MNVFFEEKSVGRHNFCWKEMLTLWEIGVDNTKCIYSRLHPPIRGKNDIRDVCSIADFFDSRLVNIVKISWKYCENIVKITWKYRENAVIIFDIRKGPLCFCLCLCLFLCLCLCLCLFLQKSLWKDNFCSIALSEFLNYFPAFIYICFREGTKKIRKNSCLWPNRGGVSEGTSKTKPQVCNSLNWSCKTILGPHTDLQLLWSASVTS